MARGKQYEQAVQKAVELLSDEMNGAEISRLLGIPKRSAYTLIEKAEERKAKEEAERIEHERLEMELERLEAELERVQSANIALSLERERNMFKGNIFDAARSHHVRRFYG